MENNIANKTLTLEKALAALEDAMKTIEILTARIDKLEKENKALKEQLNMNSKNSSKPPSSDGYVKPSPESQRKPSGKKQGGQMGHKGHGIKLDAPDRVVKVYPSQCKNCSNRDNCGKLHVHDTCYRIDTVIQKETVEYKILECDCDGINEVAERPAGLRGSVSYGTNLRALICVLSVKGMVAMKNLCEIVEGLTSIKPSTGTVANMLKSAANSAELIVKSYPQKLSESPVVHCDETGLSVNSKTHWVHVICDKQTTRRCTCNVCGAFDARINGNI